MTTLLDDELFDYLSHLKSEVGKRISTTDERNFQHQMHSQMGDLIGAEEEFLRYVNSNGTQPVLSISPNGLPSVASLVPDLEQMCELTEEETSFREVVQRFKKGMNGKNRGENSHIYVPVSEDEWNRELNNRNGENLQSHFGFEVKETEDGRFELGFREDVHVQGYDEHSKEFPVLVREGKMRYHVVWNRLVDDAEESFYVPNTALVLQGRPIKSPEKQYDNIVRTYGFGRFDFRGARKPLFLRWRGDSVDYERFLAAGTGTRIRITENILSALGRALERQVAIQGVSRKDLEQTLAFSTIPFKNAPGTTPKEEDFYENNGQNYGYKKLGHKHPVVFDLVFITGGDKAGEIEYILPHNKRHYGAYGGLSGYRFTKGGVRLNILGTSVLNEEQYHALQRELKRIKKR